MTSASALASDESEQLASLSLLDAEHMAAFRRALDKVLLTEVAENTCAEIIDGLPTRESWRDFNPWRPGHPVEELKHDKLCAGSHEKARELRSDLDIYLLSFPAWAALTLWMILIKGSINMNRMLPGAILQVIIYQAGTAYGHHFESLTQFLLGSDDAQTQDRGSCPIPIRASLRNGWRYHADDAISRFNIFRDRYERKELPSRCESRINGWNWPEVAYEINLLNLRAAGAQGEPVDDAEIAEAEEGIKRITPSSPNWWQRRGGM
ncbi:hypothetical protein LA080_001060 [Diaporthe eres]|nr:hypothetical protein LA080_001060 [Diaporthe eres]